MGCPPETAQIAAEWWLHHRRRRCGRGTGSRTLSLTVWQWASPSGPRQDLARQCMRGCRPVGAPVSACKSSKDRLSATCAGPCNATITEGSGEDPHSASLRSSTR
eukprot:8723779-Pyramimonas_sp.AAC.1